MTPTFFNLMLTNEEGNRVYISVLTLKENPLDPQLELALKAFNITSPKDILIPKSIVIVSHYSFTQNY